MKQFEKLADFCRKSGISYDDSSEKMFEGFCEILIEKNKVMNLTAVTDPDEVEIKHFIDSVASAATIKDLFGGCEAEKVIKVIDIGTGAGFPGVPLAIVIPSYQFVLADSLNKRIDFLKETAEYIGLSNIEPIQGRAEDLGQSELRESFDLCVSRAVANLSVLLEYGLPLIKVGGYAVLYKSGDFTEELEESEYAMQILGGKLKEIKEFMLPGTDIRRSLIIIEKVEATPDKYPRRAGKPSKSPLLKK